MRWYLALGLLVIGCKASSTEAAAEPGDGGAANANAAPGSVTASTTCDPLNPTSEAIALGSVLAAGRATDETLYIVDRPSGQFGGERLFKSVNGVLQRQHVTGSGSGPDFVILTYPAGQVRVELANGAVTRMGATDSLVADPKTKSFDIDAAHQLTLVGPEAYSALPVADLTEITVLYDATTPDGQRFIGLYPTADYKESTLRVFYGPDNHLVERRVIALTAGSSVDLTFDLDGVSTHAHLWFGGPIGGPVAFGGPSRLEPSDRVDIVAPTRPLTPAEGSPGYGAKDPDFTPDAAPPPPMVYKTAAELTAGLTFVCF